ncbi:hypothetical protein [Streptomyces sp. NPDC017202]|uniref:hypothetical protein n=1 Tax=Streptomyces sp. NPDC017202 TaxID=3364981 RepID=UPI00379E9DBA
MPSSPTAGVFLGGVFLGGVLTQWLSRPRVFIVHVPLGLATLGATKLLPAGGGRRGRVDVLGAVAVTAGPALAVFAAVRAPQAGGPRPAP